MSRPAMAAHSSSLTHSVESRASLRRSVSATLAGIWAGWCHEPCARSSRISSLTKNGLPPLRSHSWAVTWGGRGVPASSRASAPTLVRGEAGQGELLGLPGDLAQLRGRLGVPVGAEQGHGLRGQGAGQESQQPQRRLVGPVQVVEHHEHGPPGGQAAEAPRDRLEQAELGVARGGGAHRFGRPGGRLQQPARLAEVGRWQAAGLQHLRPGPVRWRAVAFPAEPAQDEGSRPSLADQRGQHRRLADAGLAADHQELPGAVAGIVEYRTGGGQYGLPADEPGGSTHGFIMAGQGRSSNTRFIGAGTSSLRTRPNPASAARARSRCWPARPSGSDDVAVFWDTAFGVQARVETA